MTGGKKPCFTVFNLEDRYYLDYAYAKLLVDDEAAMDSYVYDMYLNEGMREYLLDLIDSRDPGRVGFYVRFQNVGGSGLCCVREYGVGDLLSLYDNFEGLRVKHDFVKKM